jgi:hypothetical protein
MIHEFGERVKIVTNFETRIISFFKDGKKYNEMPTSITIQEFEDVLDRTESEFLKLNEWNPIT